uniref:Uncharacterized protein n=1 Tax=Oryza sativa subsp. japonica TaxID=39947 RepID=Q5Z950_ORYSJ|nr:hypothetical protein [Oryza sativa Japonica Group]
MKPPPLHRPSDLLSVTLLLRQPPAAPASPPHPDNDRSAPPHATAAIGGAARSIGPPLRVSPSLSAADHASPPPRRVEDAAAIHAQRKKERGRERKGEKEKRGEAAAACGRRQAERCAGSIGGRARLQSVSGDRRRKATIFPEPGTSVKGIREPGHGPVAGASSSPVTRHPTAPTPLSKCDWVVETSFGIIPMQTPLGGGAIAPNVGGC